MRSPHHSLIQFVFLLLSRTHVNSVSALTSKYSTPPPPPMPQHHHHSNQYHTNSNNTSTLGRFSKSTNRLQSPQGPPEMYRSVQTLPRKLEPNGVRRNVSVIHTSQPTATNTTRIFQNTGPAKPARTYKSLNRSKSFNVHGMNGHPTDFSPIYMEKLTSQPKSNLYNSSQHYKSTSHLIDSPRSNIGGSNGSNGMGLKSPSIVNLISRSQRDLTAINDNELYSTPIKNRPSTLLNNGNDQQVDKKSIFLRGLQDQAPELYKTLVEEERHRASPFRNNFKESSIGSRSPVTINKDTAQIIRRGSSSTDDFAETYRYTTRGTDNNRPSVTNTVQNVSRKTIPSKDGRGREVINTSESKSVTKIGYNN